MRRVAAFVDAGYFWVQVAHLVYSGRLVAGAKPSRSDIQIDYPAMRTALVDAITTQFPTADLLRIYWYDGPGQNGKTPHHTSIEQIDDFKLRLGTRNGFGDQKAVDGLIIADMIALAQNRSISDALLVSGDADLTPGVAAAQNLGIRVHLLSMGSSAATSPYLEAEVDRRAHWEDGAIRSFATPAAIASKPAMAVAPEGAAAPSGKLIHLTQEQLTGIAKPIKESLSSADREQLMALAPAIPQHIDVALLRAGTKTAGRKLEDIEKRRLRAAFQASP